MLDIIYEDNHIIVVIKPQNVPTQEDSSEDLDMLTIVKQYIKEKYDKKGNVYVGLVHRLDRPTGGVMVFAKTSKAASRLGEQIQNGEMQKSYLAVLKNTPKEMTGHLENYLKKNSKTNMVEVVPQLTTDAKKAILNYKVVESIEDKCLVDVDLVTGRSHQIRAQFKNLSCPVYNDAKYGGDDMPKGNLALWAYSLKFVHPTTKDNMTFKVFPPIEKSPWKLFNVENYLNKK